MQDVAFVRSEATENGSEDPATTRKSDAQKYAPTHAAAE